MKKNVDLLGIKNNKDAKILKMIKNKTNTNLISSINNEVYTRCNFSF